MFLVELESRDREGAVEGLSKRSQPLADARRSAWVAATGRAASTDPHTLAVPVLKEHPRELPENKLVLARDFGFAVPEVCQTG